MSNSLEEEDRGLSQHDLATRFAPLIIPGQELSVLSIEQLLGKHLNSFQTVLVSTSTASGKSTQIPQMLNRLGWCKNGFQIAIVQPNHLTATRLAQRLQSEMEQDAICRLCTQEVNEPAMQTSLFTIFDQESFLRNGFGLDPKLLEYSLVFLDEVHERLLAMDLIFGLLMRLQSTLRLDLRLVLASATLDTNAFLRFFPQSSLITCNERELKTHIAYLREPCAHYLNTCAELIADIHKTNAQGGGDVLVFCPTREECDYLVRRVQEENHGLLCLFLHEAMTSAEQQLVVTASVGTSKRKVIVATPALCETSIAIPNIGFVIDSMFAQQVEFQSETGLHALVIRGISKARANQRAGRVGRSGGKCFRLCTELDFCNLLPKHSEAEILRADLTDAVLKLKSLGLDTFASDFAFMTPPKRESLLSALDLLYALGAVDSDAELTREGKAMAMLPVSVRLAKVLLQAAAAGSTVLKEASLDLVALLASGVGASLLAHSKQGALIHCAAKEGDHLTMLNLMNQSSTTTMQQDRVRFAQCRANLLSSLQQVDMEHLPEVESRKLREGGDGGEGGLMECILAGFFTQAARLNSNGLYSTIRTGREVRLHSSSTLSKFGKPPEYIVFHEAVLVTESHRRALGQDEDVVLVRIVSAIDPRMLLQVAPHFWKLM